MVDLPIETCEECGFNGREWSDAEAIAAIGELPGQFVAALADLSPDERSRRPFTNQWSIAEYVDHVREVIFGMRFLLEMTATQPGTDIGASPSPPFQPEAQRIDVEAALAGIEQEATLLVASVLELPTSAWTSTVTIDERNVDPQWIVRHTVHDATHHLMDIERLHRAMCVSTSLVLQRLGNTDE